jgi:FAD/FMN-containing dehydrogenase
MATGAIPWYKYEINQPADWVLYSSLPARWIDELLIESPNWGDWSAIDKFTGRSLSLLISTTVFPIFLALDLSVYAVKSLICRCQRLFDSDPALQAHGEACHQVFIKCLRGLATFPAGILWRDIVSNHFLEEKKHDGRLHPTGGLYASGAHIQRPQNSGEVQAWVRYAKQAGQKISIGGAGYSQGKQILPPNEHDLHLDMSGLNGIRVKPEEKIVQVGAGATWKEVQAAANEHGLAVQVMQASNVFSVGGSISANCHGWDHKMGAIANTIRSLTIVDAEGNLQRLTPQDELFGYVVGGYGMFGVIVEAELALTDNEELFQFAEPIAPKDYARYFEEQILPNPHLRMHLYRLSLKPGSLLQEGYAENFSVKGPAAPSTALADEPENGTTLHRILMQVARNSPYARGLFWDSQVKEMSKMTRGKRNEIMRPPILAAFANNSRARAEWLQEYFVPKEQLADFLAFLGQVLNENEVALLNASVRFVRKDDKAKLGYASQGDRFAVVLFFSQSLNKEEVEKTQTWVRQVIDYLGHVGGTFYLPYIHFATQEQFAKCYPAAAQVAEKKREIDPEASFANGFYQDYLQ